MNIELLGPLALLALIDSTSFGTLLIPLWLMSVPDRPRPGRMVLFLATVAAFYLLLGITLLLGASMLLDALRETGNAQLLRIAQLVVGIGLIVLGVRMQPWTKAGKERRVARRAEKLARNGPSLLMRMRGHATDASAPVGAIIVFALTAAGIEAASMIPYLAAIGLLTASELSLTGRIVVLLGYCLLMITPALLLLVARLMLHVHVSPVLEKLEASLSRNASEVMAWWVSLVGLWLVFDGLNALARN
jgi:hypothetical protein